MCVMECDLIHYENDNFFKITGNCIWPLPFTKMVQILLYNNSIYFISVLVFKIFVQNIDLSNIKPLIKMISNRALK